MQFPKVLNPPPLLLWVGTIIADEGTVMIKEASVLTAVINFGKDRLTEGRC